MINRVRVIQTLPFGSRAYGILKVIKPNFDYKKYKKLAILFLTCMLASYVLFGFLAGFSNRIFGEFNIALIAIPFSSFFVSSIAMSFCFAKYSYASQAESIIKQIKANDKILIAEISMFYREEDMLLIVNKLLETGNLSDYENIGDIMVAKKELCVSESEARKEYNEFKGINTYVNVNPVQTEPDSYNVSYCPECGTKNRIYDKYCSNCGRRINDNNF